jgi:hypothetical protein
MWRLAAGARAVADFRFDDRIEGILVSSAEADTSSPA